MEQPANKFGIGVDSDPLEGIALVRDDGMNGDTDLRANLFGSQAHRDELGNLQLPRAQSGMLQR